MIHTDHSQAVCQLVSDMLVNQAVFMTLPRVLLGLVKFFFRPVFANIVWEKKEINKRGDEACRWLKMMTACCASLG
jgi:hypothetical protein